MAAIFLQMGVIMQGFVYLFELFTILMGLAVAVMFKGFADILRLRFRRKAGIDTSDLDIKIGWLLPLLGLFMLFNIASFWLLIHPLRDILPFNFTTIMAIFMLMGGYYILASLIFPSEPKLWISLDDYYWQSKRFILVGTFLLIIIGNIGIGALGFNGYLTSEYLAKYPIFKLVNLLILISLPLMLWASLSKNYKVNFYFLIYYVIVNLLFIVAEAITPPYTEGMAL